MKKDVADRWVAALRSGKYKQGKGCLRTENRYCCLGVLCEIEGLKSEVEEDEIYYFIGSEGDRSAERLPASLVKKVGMWSNSGRRIHSIQEADISALMSLNDNGETFEEIADVIEKHWEEL